MNFQEQKNCHDLKFNQLRRMEPKKPLLQRNCLLYVSSDINSWLALSCVGSWITMQDDCSNNTHQSSATQKKKLCQVISIIIKYWRNLSTSSELSHSTSKLCQMISIIILEKSLNIFGIIPFYLKISKLIPNIRYLRKLSNKIPFFLLQNKEWYILILIRKINYLIMQCQEVLYVICIVSNHRSNILLRTYLTILVIIMFVEGRLHLII